MNEQEQNRYEAELRRARPAPVPENFMARLRAAKPPLPPGRSEANTLFCWRWLAPAMAAAVAGLLVLRAELRPKSAAENRTPVIAKAMKADDVRVNEELVSSYEVVAKLPGGEPVRFRCQKWRDQWSVSDTNRGVEIVQDRPRVEVMPVRFETY